MSRLLRAAGYAVEIHASAAEFLAANRAAPGCVVLDVGLPGMNGLDLLELLRERAIKLPAILITSHPTAAIRNRATSAGVRLIEKPLLNDTLFQCIRSMLGWDSAHQ